MAHRIHASVERVQPSRHDPAVNGAVAQW